MKKMNKKGFTLMEMLIVVAIIAVLVAIAIPVMNAQLEKAREAVDAANLRSAYAEISAEALLNNGTSTPKDVTQKQTKAGWEYAEIDFPKNFKVDPPKASGTWTVKWVTTSGGAVQATN